MKKAKPPITMKRRREDESIPRYKNTTWCLFFFLSLNRFVYCLVCVCEQLSCVHYESDTIHYLFISSVCLLATLCISACLAIIMPHALFKTHVHTDYDADSYLSVNHSLIASSVSL